MEKRRLRIALLEPFFGGSHRAVAEGWARHSRHKMRLETLPPRFWKWRMRGAALEFARRLAPRMGDIDVLFVTDLLDLAHLRALLPRRVPAVLYFHENQVAYPARPGEEVPERDLQFAFTNLASALAADRLAFNSAFQWDAFRDALAKLLRRMPDARPLWALKAVEAKATVLPLGVELSDVPARRPSTGEPPLVLWNHRWEYDKDPETFFSVLRRLAGRGIEFRVAVAGEAFGRAPEVFARARGALGTRVVHWGYLPARAEYAALLARADVVVSTALQENFGISLVEAAFAGAHPLAPHRLSYPEVLPAELHAQCLYADAPDLEERLATLLEDGGRRIAPLRLRRLLGGHGWESRAAAFDDLVLQVFEDETVRPVI